MIHFSLIKKFQEESQNKRIQDLVFSVEQELPRHWKRLVPDICFWVTTDDLTECPEFRKKMDRSMFINASSEGNPDKALNMGMVLSCDQGGFEVFAGKSLALLSDEHIRLSTGYKIAEVMFIRDLMLQAQFLRIFGPTHVKDVELFGTVFAEAFITKPAFSNLPNKICGIVKRKFEMLDQYVRAVSASCTN